MQKGKERKEGKSCKRGSRGRKGKEMWCGRIRDKDENGKAGNEGLQARSGVKEGNSVCVFVCGQGKVCQGRRRGRETGMKMIRKHEGIRERRKRA